MEKYIALMSRLGIGEKISRVYLDLLEHGTSNVSEIAKRTSLHRIEVYRAIPLLLEEKFIIELLRGKRTYYRPLAPDRLDAMIRDFEKRNTPLVSELKEKYEKLEKNITVRYQE
jgi:sugar-specific transcriptional regulator TrmB